MKHLYVVSDTLCEMVYLGWMTEDEADEVAMELMEEASSELAK